MNMMKLLKRDGWWMSQTGRQLMGEIGELVTRIEGNNGVNDILSYRLESLLHHAVWIRTQPVADWYWAQDKDVWYIHHDFPNCAPPWPLAWFDWSNHNTQLKGGGLCGALMISAPTGYERPLPPWYGSKWPREEYERWAAVWLVFDQVRSEKGEDQGILQGAAIICVSNAGRPFGSGMDKESGLHTYSSWGQLRFRGRKLNADMKELTVTVLTALNVPLLALSFANCKNTKVIPDPSTMPKRAKTQPKAPSNNQEPQTKWHILEIGGTTRLVQEVAAEAGEPGAGGKRKLHLARGHFKDYEEGKGLFGHLHGTYFWNPSTRGNKDKGTVLKDYKIRGGQ